LTSLKRKNAANKEEALQASESKVFDGYFLHSMEKIDHEGMLRMLQGKVVPKFVRTIPTQGIKDAISCHWTGPTTILVSGWQNNQNATGFYETEGDKPADILSNKYLLQVATYNNLLIGADLDSEKIVVQDRQGKCNNVSSKPFMSVFLDKFVTFSRVFVIVENFLYFTSKNEQLIVVDLDNNYQEINTDRNQVQHFSIFGAGMSLLYSDKSIGRFHLTEKGEVIPINSCPIAKSKNHDFHTIHAYQGYTFAVGTKKIDRKGHNRILLFDKNLAELDRVDTNEIACELPRNPIQGLKAVMQKNVVYLLALNVFFHGNLFAVVDKKLKVLSLFNRFGSSRLNGCCFYNQYSSKILIFGYGEVSEYIL